MQLVFLSVWSKQSTSAQKLTFEIAKCCWRVVSLAACSHRAVPVCPVAMCIAASDNLVIGFAEQHRRSLRIQVRYFSIIWRYDCRTSGFCGREKNNAVEFCSFRAGNDSSSAFETRIAKRICNVRTYANRKRVNGPSSVQALRVTFSQSTVSSVAIKAHHFAFVEWSD